MAKIQVLKNGPVVDVVDNAFCPTGKGGGVDPSCGSGKNSTRLQRGTAASKTAHDATTKAYKEKTVAAHMEASKAHSSLAFHPDVGQSARGNHIEMGQKHAKIAESLKIPQLSIDRHVAKISKTTKLEGKDLRDLGDWLERQASRFNEGKETAGKTLQELSDYWIKRASGK